MIMEDNVIIMLYNSRSESAISETEKKYGAYCRSIAFNILHDHFEVEECVNDTYLKVWNAIPPTQPSSLQSFIGRIVRNTALNLFKKKKTKKRGSGQFDEVYDELNGELSRIGRLDDYSDIELRDLLNRFLDSLTEENKAVFIGRYWYFESVAEISKIMHISQSKTKALLMKCRNELKIFLLLFDLLK